MTEEAVEQKIAEREAKEEKKFSDAFAEASGTGSSSSEDEALESEAETETESEEEPDEELEADDVEEESATEDEKPELSLEEQLAAVKAENETLARDKQQLEHRVRSDSGRVSAYQRQIEELQAKTVNESVSSGDTAQQAQDKAQEEIANKMNGSNWDEFKEDFPEVASAVELRINQQIDDAVSKRIGTLEQKIQPLQDSMEQKRLNEEFAALEAAHPDFRDIAVSSEFREWLTGKPEPVQRLFDSNAAHDAAYLLDTYKLETGISRDSSAQTQKQNRSRLEQNLSVPSSRTARKPVASDDFSSAFSSAVRKRAR